MTNNKALSIFNQLRPVTVGFDNVFDHFERMFEDDFFRLPTTSNFPPYNIRKDGDYKYVIEMALAGFGKEDIEVELENGILTVRSIKENDADETVVHRGISYRKFTRKFTLADDIVVNDAKLENGLLNIRLEQVIPEEKKPRLIDVK